MLSATSGREGGYRQNGMAAKSPIPKSVSKAPAAATQHYIAIFSKGTWTGQSSRARIPMYAFLLPRLERLI
jgi:hypothetical protein